jgi:Etoposide-induced protein 2.4 (EI24)
MNNFIDSFGRAALYCLHPRVIALSILPVVIMGALSLTLGYFYWESALMAVRSNLESYETLNAMVAWLEGVGMGSLHLVVAPALLLSLAIPVIVVVTLLFVAMFMTPSMVALVADRRFPRLERKKGGSLLAGVMRSLGSTLLAAIVLMVTIPLWLVPPLILILPPLIWGWLTYRVMSYDSLADHASCEERQLLFRQNRFALLGVGVLSGYLGAAPSLLWASGAVFVAMAPILVPLAILIYTLVFAFSSLWFAHYSLAALEQLRKKNRVPAQSACAQYATEFIADKPYAGILPRPVPGFRSPGGQSDSLS